MKKVVFFGLVLVILVLVGFMFLADRKATEGPIDENLAESEVAREVGTAFFDDFIAIAPPSDDQEAEERLMETLSERAFEEIGRDTLSRDLALFVGVQDVPDEGVEFVDIVMEDNETAILTARLNYSGAPAIREVRLVYEAGSWKVDAITAKREVDFSEIGNLTIDSPGLPEGVWHLVYEAPGAPALNRELTFVSSSLCVIEGVETKCESVDLENGTRVEVKGFEQEGVVEVLSLEYLEN